MLLSGHPIEMIALDTPGGVSLELGLLAVEITTETVRCAVRKESGDDPDITNGTLVFADVRRIPNDIVIDGGEGVGRITKPGLDQPVGVAAINSVPRHMIGEATKSVCEQYGYTGGLEVIVSIPDGGELALRTFNPRLGITGGISVLGTTGIVEPMSNAALVGTIRVEMQMLAASGVHDVLITPGNYGMDFAKNILGLSLCSQVTSSNFIGDTIAAAVECGFLRILLVGHIGKLVKLSIGMTNTHSAQGDGRVEALIACALEAGGNLELLKGISRCATSDAALSLLAEAGVLQETMSILGQRIQACLMRQVPPDVDIGYVCFSNAAPEKNVLVESANANRLMETWR